MTDAAVLPTNDVTPVAPSAAVTPSKAAPNAGDNVPGFNASESAVLRADAAHFVAIGKMTQTEADAMLSDVGLVAKPASANTPAHVDMFIEDIMKTGKTREQAVAELKAEGFMVPDVAQTPITPEEAALNIEFPPGAAPAEYDLPPLVSESEPYTPEIAQFAKQVRGWASDLGLTKEVGNYLFKEVDKVFEKTQGMSAKERENYRLSEEATAKQVLGPNWKRRLDGATDLLMKIEKTQPGLLAILAKSNANISATVAVHITQACERLAARQRKMKV